MQTEEPKNEEEIKNGEEAGKETDNETMERITAYREAKLNLIVIAVITAICAVALGITCLKNRADGIAFNDSRTALIIALMLLICVVTAFYRLVKFFMKKSKLPTKG